MENLWRAARVAVLYLTSHMKIQNKFEERDELIDDCIFRGVRYFLRDKIGCHTYNRDFSFFENVYSSCWSATSNELRCTIPKRRKMMLVNSISEEIGQNLTVEDTLMDTGKHPLDGTWAKEAGYAILTREERSRFDITVYKREPIATLKALWQLQDEDNELAGTPTDEDEYERREAILAKYEPVAQDKPKSNTKEYKRESAHRNYMRHRDRKLANAKQYRAEHRDEVRAYMHEYHQKHKKQKEGG